MTSALRGLTKGTNVNVAAMADIVKDLVADGTITKDDMWLRERVAAAHLTSHEYAALKALRERLVEQREALLPKALKGTWN